MQDSWQKRYLRHVRDTVEREGRSLSSVARAAGISTTTLTRALKESYKFEPKLTTLEAVERETGIPFLPFRDAAGVEGDLPSIAGDKGREILPAGTPASTDTALIPIYDVRASAGPGQIPDEYVAVTDRVSFAMDYIRRVIRADPRRLALITVAGDSMRPLLEDGDLVLIDMGRTVPDVEGLYVFRHGETIHIKRMIRSARAGHVWALPENPAYPREEYPLDAISVIGRVVWAGGAL